MHNYMLISFLVINNAFNVALSTRILVLIPYKSYSHFQGFESLLDILAKRGHEVVVVSHYPKEVPVENYTDISILGSMECLTNKMPFKAKSKEIFPGLRLMEETTSKCEPVYKHPNAQQLIKMNASFDLIMTEIFGSDCFLGFVHKFQAPFIGFLSSLPYPWSNFRVGNPDNPAYVPNYFVPFIDRMNFLERTINTGYLLATNWVHYFFSEIKTSEITNEHFVKRFPPLSSLAKNISMILVNSHFNLLWPRHTVPALVEIGGIHADRSQKLCEDIERYLNESEHGVIYFNMGTMIRADTLSTEKLQAFLDVFAELPQRVLWKCNATNMPALPTNVRTYNWMPQRDILGHPNVRVFITHGGMMGTQEAVYTGVPMLGIPLFADQLQNIHNYVEKGIAVQLNYDSINKETLQTSLRQLLYNSSYRENAQRMSSLFRDRPQTPLETAVFWTEYVIRHGGAPHMRSAAVDLPLYQYLLLDVIVVLVLGLISICVLIYTFIIKLVHCCLFITNALSRYSKHTLIQAK